MTTPNIACATCAHFTVGTRPPACAAFPNGIPDEIRYGDNPHTEPFEGDHGIRYLPLPGFESKERPDTAGVE